MSSCLLAAFAHLSIVFLAFKPPTTSPLTCEDDWASQNVTFDTSVMRRTIVTEFRLVCDRAAFLPLLTFSYMLAIAITNIFSGQNISTLKIFHISIISGILSDTFGRKEGSQTPWKIQLKCYRPSHQLSVS